MAAYATRHEDPTAEQVLRPLALLWQHVDDRRVMASSRGRHMAALVLVEVQLLLHRYYACCSGLDDGCQTRLPAFYVSVALV